MADSPHAHLWPELRRRGLLADTPPLRLGGGNLDRRTELARAIYRILQPDGSSAKLTVASDLSLLATQAHAWRTACPTLSGRSFFRLTIDGCDLLAEEFFEGLSLQAAVCEGAVAPVFVHRAVQTTLAALRDTRHPSTSARRQTEWEAWATQLLALPVWSPADQTYLRDQLLPLLSTVLLDGPPVCQRVHGDLTDGNLLLTPLGRPRLIDPEFTTETHFFATESARFHLLSPAVAAQPALFAAICPPPSPPVQIHCWLTQIQRELACNQSAYVARWLPHRLATIRRLAETCAPASPGLCPWPATPPGGAPALDTAQLFWAGDTGWTETQSCRLNFRRDLRQTAFFPVPSSAQPWRLDPAASAYPTTVSRIAGYSAAHEPVVEIAGSALHSLERLALEDTSVDCTPEGLLISSKRGDPQLVFRLPVTSGPEVAWLEVELINRTSQPSLAPDHHIEEVRWLGQQKLHTLRIAGWCLPPLGESLISIEASIAGRSVARAPLVPRPDVARAFPDRPEALLSGFALELPCTDVRDFVHLHARTQRSELVALTTLQAGDVPGAGPILGDYPAWAARHDMPPSTSDLSGLPSLRFSILLPIYNTPENFLRACVDSVLAQHYPDWELCVVDDGSDTAWIAGYFAELGRADPRIRFQRRTANGGIARATNDALALARGDFVLLLDHDDLLRPHTLAEFARRLAAEPSLDALYSDEDKISAGGDRLVPFLKPAFSPEFLLGVMYVGHALCVRTAIARDAGGFDPRFDGVQDYEFFLRVTEHTRRIAHLPKILYHWRQSPGSSALHGNVKGDMDARQLTAVEAHLHRTGQARHALALGGHRVRLQALPDAPRPSTALLLAWSAGSIIDRVDLVRLGGDNVTFFSLADTPLPAGAPAPRRLAATTLADALRDGGPLLTADFVVVLTHPPLALSPGWIDELVTLAARPDSALVAPLILSGEGPVLESGWTIEAGTARPLMRGFDPSGDGYNGSLLCSREVAAVSPLCFAFARRGSIAATLACHLDDWLEGCRRLRAEGRFHRICATARVRVSRSWRSIESADAGDHRSSLEEFYNPHFDLRHANYALASLPRRAPPRERFLWHLDLTPPASSDDGCVEVRGWCFSREGGPVFIEVEVGPVTWRTSCDQPRPDVADSHPDSTDGRCGFTVRLRVPPGRHSLRVTAHDSDSASLLLLDSAVTVSTLSSLHRVFRQRPARRLAFQLLAGPAHPPHPIVPERFPAPRCAERWPKFTIVTPSYQQAEFLEETVRSVLQQPSVRCDYIIQDGGSRDGSDRIIARHADRLHSFSLAPDHGQADAIARGFERSAGTPTDLMAWLNSDDVYLPGALAYVADFFARHPDVDVLYGNRVLIDESSREIGRWFLPRHDTRILRVNDFVPQETLFWRRRLWEKVGGLDRSLRFAMDWDLLLRFADAGARFAHTPHFLACFRLHPQQKTSAALHCYGQAEIDTLRRRTFGRDLTAIEIEQDPTLAAYLRASAALEWRWRLRQRFAPP